MSENQQFAVLRSAAEWDAYKVTMAAALGLSPQTVTWGGGPQQYPCLVASLPISGAPIKILSCYVYAADALRLLQSAGLQALPVSALPAAAAPAGITATNLVECCHSLIAHVLAIIDLDIRTGLYTEETYEENYTKFLAGVDQVAALQTDVRSLMVRRQAGA